jgi:glyoxylase-like metal-dependent hydrolase (beta-lactamase superfamily II)
VKLSIIPVTPYQQNCSLVVCATTGQAALVDPGGEVDRLLAAVEASGATLARVLVTHGHVDHCGGAAEVLRAGVPIEDRSGRTRSGSTARRQGPSGVPGARLHPTDRAATRYVGSWLTPPSGHTWPVVFVQPERRIAFVGDVLFQGSVGRTDFPRGDFATLVRSITEQLWPLGDDIQFVPGHGPMSTFGDERRSNPFVGDHALRRGGHPIATPDTTGM